MGIAIGVVLLILFAVCVGWARDVAKRNDRERNALDGVVDAEMDALDARESHLKAERALIEAGQDRLDSLRTLFDNVKVDGLDGGVNERLRYWKAGSSHLSSRCLELAQKRAALLDEIGDEIDKY